MFSMPSLIVILVIVILLFGTKRLKNIGSDLGGALKGFKKAVDDGEVKKEASIEEKKDANVIEGEVVKEETKVEK
ncbi:MAG: twin-arginine translocase TatA/TatE family subunit [Kangiellaceae bacterium]|nr:twin-arginine translocase TatA/TatE family subunit [Kangiellaceae bacterium]